MASSTQMWCLKEAFSSSGCKCSIVFFPANHGRMRSQSPFCIQAVSGGLKMSNKSPAARDENGSTASKHPEGRREKCLWKCKKSKKWLFWPLCLNEHAENANHQKAKEWMSKSSLMKSRKLSSHWCCIRRSVFHLCAAWPPCTERSASLRNQVGQVRKGDTAPWNEHALVATLKLQTPWWRWRIRRQKDICVTLLQASHGVAAVQLGSAGGLCSVCAHVQSC